MRDKQISDCLKAIQQIISLIENLIQMSLMLQATYAAVILTIVAVKAKNKMQGKWMFSHKM